MCLSLLKLYLEYRRLFFPDMMYTRGRQSPARGPNPAREFRPSGPRRLVSFNINSARKSYRTMSDCFPAERDLVAHW